MVFFLGSPFFLTDINIQRVYIKLNCKIPVEGNKM